MQRAILLFVSLLLCHGIAYAAAGALRTEAAQFVQTPYLFRLDGKVEASSAATIAAQTTGQVAQVLVDVDDVVKEGDLVVVLRDTEQRARLEQAEARQRAAQARENEAAQEFARVRDIHAKKLVAKAELDKATAALESARAAREAARADVESAREQLAYTRIKAPYSGVVTQRHVELAEIASPGSPLISGISLDRLRVNVDVPQNMVEAVRNGGQAQVLLPDGSAVQAAGLTVFPIADPGSSSFRVRLRVPPEVRGLYPGMFVKTAFLVGKVNALAVPADAIAYRSELTGIYVVDEQGGIDFRRVRVGHKLNGHLVEILSGVLEGERVALDPVAAAAALKAAQ